MSDVDYDFDAAWAERRTHGPRVRILGEIYTLPASVPAKIVLFAARAKRDGDTGRQVTAEEVVDMLGTLLGPENLDRIMSAGVGLDQLGDIMKFCTSRYNTLGGVQGEASAPVAGAGATSETTTSSG